MYFVHTIHEYADCRTSNTMLIRLTLDIFIVAESLQLGVE
jgi:hypothetical protein